MYRTLIIAAFCVLIGIPPARAQERASSPAGLALESIFNPQRAPAQKTMGLLQRSFLELVESSEPDLQIAFVVDGTDSMAADLVGVRQALQSMVQDLRHYKGDHVSFSLVIYRDSGSPSGEVTIPLSQFTSDVNALMAGFEKLVPESGAPYFLELPDLGVQAALEKLNWSDSRETSRWILLFGDAPPYDPSFVDSDSKTGARRRYDTDLLVNQAKLKGVQINCVLCTSREEERTVYEQVLDRTRQFMNALATNTGGLMLDLSYPDIRLALVETSKQKRVERQRIGLITREEVDAAKRAATAVKAPPATGQRLRIAVLPHLPLALMTFDATHEAVQIASELRQKLRSVPHTDVRSPVDVDRAFRRVKAENVPTEQWLQALAVQLRVDYLVWGTFRRDQGIVRVRSSVFSKTDGQKIVETTVLTSADLPETKLAGDVINKLTLTAFDQQKAPELHSAFVQLRDDASLRTQVLTPVADVAEVRTELLAGFELLEQALAYPVGDATGRELLNRAEKSLTKAAADDVRNPFIHMLLASCCYNQAQAATSQGQSEVAKTKGTQYLEAIKRAYRERNSTPVDLLKLEIAADHALLVDKDYNAAIKLYSQLATAPNDAKLHTALRAHWMLAGIYSGDWGAAAAVNPAQAREHLIHILAHWPDSSEAAFIKAQLRWSDEKGRTQFEFFPRQNDGVLKNA